jgi:autotransporter-associated beta strand protein
MISRSAAWVTALLLAHGAVTPAAAQEVTTSWTAAGGDNLWANPLNWSHGVPGQLWAYLGDSAAPGTTIDLGGVPRNAPVLRGWAKRFELANGGFSTRRALVDAGADVLVTQWDRDPHPVLMAHLDGTLRVAAPPQTFSAGPGANPIVPWAIGLRFGGTETTFLRYDAGANAADPVDDGGFLPFANPATELSPTPAANADVRVAQPVTVAAPVTINSLTIRNATLTLNAPLTVHSGGVLLLPGAGASSVTPATTITGSGSLHLPAEAIVHAMPRDNFYAYDNSTSVNTRHLIDVPIHGAGTLGSYAQGTLILNKPNTYAGGTMLEAGAIQINDAAALGSGPVTFAGGRLQIDVADATIPNDFVLARQIVIQPPLAAQAMRVPDGLTTLSGAFRGAANFSVSGASPAARVRLTGVSDAGAQLTFNTGAYVDGAFTNPAVLVSGGSAQANLASSWGGTGSIAGTFRPHGNLMPGPADGGVGELTFGQGRLGFATVHIDLLGDSAAQHDRLVALQSLELATMLPNSFGRAKLDVHLAFAAEPGDEFTIIDNRFSGAVVDTFTNLPEGAEFTDDGGRFRISYVGGDGNDVVLAVVPEPSTAAVVAAALLLYAAARRPPRGQRGQRGHRAAET